MNKTYTPLIIEGKIYVVVDAPDIWSYNKPGLDALIERLTKYPTLEQDAPYWKERIGQRVEVEINYLSWANKEHPAGNYAIPPQQKQGDDLWDEFIEFFLQVSMDNLTNDITHVGDDFTRYLADKCRNNYHLTKK